MTVGLASTDAGPNRGKRPAHGDALLDKAFALLAAFTEQRRSMSLTELSRHAGLPKSTRQVEPEGRPVSSTQLRRSLAEVRRNGYATAVRGDPGPLLSIAVPIWQDSTTVAGALSVVVPATGAQTGPLTLRVRTAAHAVSRDLTAAGGHVPR